MGFRDDFYIKENIMGYTGNLYNNPTVYFSDSGKEFQDWEMTSLGGRMLVQFGRITQDYPRTSTNVGRAPVRKCYSYSIYNDESDRAVESVHGQLELDIIKSPSKKIDLTDFGYNILHTSRGRFERVTDGTVVLLALSIKLHKLLKPRHWQQWSQTLDKPKKTAQGKPKGDKFELGLELEWEEEGIKHAQVMGEGNEDFEDLDL